MIFHAIQDFADALATMPREHPRYRILKLLYEAIRLEVQFIDSQPSTLFQSLWNRCWWYDCPECTNHQVTSFLGDMFKKIRRLRKTFFREINAGPPPQKLHQLLECWRFQKEQRTPEFLWLRCLRPPATSLGGRVNPLPGHGRCVELLEVSPDGTRVVVASDEHWIGVWNGTTGIMLATLFLHIRGVTNVKFAPDGSWFCGLSYYGRAMIAWETGSLKEIRKPEKELSALLFDNSRRPNRYQIKSDSRGAAILNDNGLPMVSLPPSRGWRCDSNGKIWAALVDQSLVIWRLEGDC